ncbi:hypothetical protein ABIB26_003256 [Arthrobacter sp. UYEF20]
MSVRDLAAATGDPVTALAPTALAPLFHLMWKQEISADLRRRVLHLETMVWLKGETP